MAALIRAWAADFSPENGAPLAAVHGAGTDRKTVDYRGVECYRHADGWAYSRVSGKLWQDQNHSQLTLLYLPMVGYCSTVGGATVPEAKKIPRGLNLLGAELRTSVAVNNLHLSKDVQIVVLGQWFDTEANLGKGTNVNYINVTSPTVCEALNYPSPYMRAGGVTRTDGWVSHVTRFDPEDSGWECIYGRPDKMAAGIYGGSAHTRRAFQSELLDLMLVFHCGTNPPAVEPMDRPEGGSGEFYCRQFELWVDPALNPALAQAA